jgi:hypothetical protein
LEIGVSIDVLEEHFAKELRDGPVKFPAPVIRSMWHAAQGGNATAAKICLSLAVPDWEDRIRRGQVAGARHQYQPAEQRRAVKMFERLRLPDVPGQPPLADRLR